MNKFVLVSAVDQRPYWSYQSADQLRALYKTNEFRLSEVEEFIESSRPGHFIALDDKLLFRVV